MVEGIELDEGPSARAERAVTAAAGAGPGTPRVAVVVSHPIQHFCPLYRRLAAEGRVDLHVLFGSRAGAQRYFDPGFNRVIQWKGGLLDGYAHEFLPGAEQADPAGSVDCDQLEARLAAFDPQAVVVYGFWHGISRRALHWARRQGRKGLVISDSELRTRRPWQTRVRKRLTVPFLLSRADAFLTVGDCNEAYYRAYGARQDQLFRSPFPVDDAALDAALAGRAEAREAVRGALGIGGATPVGLVVGKLTERKCPGHALRALRAVGAVAGQPPMHLVFAGDGPLRAALEAGAAQAVPGRAHFPGFVEPERLPAFYAAADFLVHPSSEDPHPLATSEAVYAGLPVVVSDRVGSVGPTDDVRIGENGLEYSFGDVEALADALRRVCEPAARGAMGARSREIGSGRTLARSAEGFVRGVFGALGAVPP